MRNYHPLPITEELDFHYLLTLMPVLKSLPEYSNLPELFSIIGYAKLVDLCRYAGGETIVVPTLEELSKSVNSIQWFYDVYIKKCKQESDIPSIYVDEVSKIKIEFDKNI